MKDIPIQHAYLAWNHNHALKPVPEGYVPGRVEVLEERASHALRLSCSEPVFMRPHHDPDPGATIKHPIGLLQRAQQIVLEMVLHDGIQLEDAMHALRVIPEWVQAFAQYYQEHQEPAAA